MPSTAHIEVTPASKLILRRLYPDGRELAAGVAIADVGAVLELEEALRDAIEEVHPGMALCQPGLAAALRAISAVTVRKLRAR
jgi:hypothetical protein